MVEPLLGGHSSHRPRLHHIQPRREKIEGENIALAMRCSREKTGENLGAR